MTNTKFIVKVDRGGTRAPLYVQRIDRTPIRTTKDRKLALVMGKFTAEDAVKSIQTSQCIPELVSVQVKYGQLSLETKLLRPLNKYSHYACPTPTNSHQWRISWNTFALNIHRID
jgi:hypothetical protein